ncbi:MAG: hypothetical protein HY904_16090 [Deltaproteobacteria bacterium]|nr:hypothetical protein [Deltaproteobacteria bacterium]
MLKRKTSLAPETDALTFLQAEFAHKDGGYDHRLSCYEVEQAECVRTHAEHFVSFTQRPPATLAHVDVGRFGPVSVATPGETDFQFTREHYREVVLDDDGAVARLAFSAHAALAEAATEVPKDAVCAYIAAALARGDAEWVALRDGPKGKDRERWWKAGQRVGG